MYKAIQNEKLYLAAETFGKGRKNISPVYKSGVRIWDSNLMKTYSVVLYRFRLMFGVKSGDTLNSAQG